MDSWDKELLEENQEWFANPDYDEILKLAFENTEFEPVSDAMDLTSTLESNIESTIAKIDTKELGTTTVESEVEDQSSTSALHGMSEASLKDIANSLQAVAPDIFQEKRARKQVLQVRMEDLPPSSLGTSSGSKDKLVKVPLYQMDPTAATPDVARRVRKAVQCKKHHDHTKQFKPLYEEAVIKIGRLEERLNRAMHLLRQNGIYEDV